MGVVGFAVVGAADVGAVVVAGEVVVVAAGAHDASNTTARMAIDTLAREIPFLKTLSSFSLASLSIIVVSQPTGVNQDIVV